jgi:hypothetical protein
MSDERIWSTSLRQTFRLLPAASDSLRVFLQSSGQHRDDVLRALPYELARARGGGTGGPDPKRYRDNRQVFRSVGLVYEEDEHLYVTPLGEATLWWLDNLSERNVPVLARYASYALSAWQLRNPSREGQQYAPEVKVFPYTTIWRVMLLAGGRINSDELARVVLKITQESEVEPAAALILDARRQGNSALMGERVTDDNDRIIPWMSLASFGWTLFRDKSDGDHPGFYEIPDSTLRIVERAAEIQRPHLEFGGEISYLKHIARAASVPTDHREE